MINKFAIYQLNKESKKKFLCMDHLKNLGLTVNKDEYVLIYSNPITSEAEINLSDHESVLDYLYYLFNMYRPTDFSGHSLAISDIIVLYDESGGKAYYCDSIGWVEVSDFLNKANGGIR